MFVSLPQLRSSRQNLATSTIAERKSYCARRRQQHHATNVTDCQSASGNGSLAGPAAKRFSSMLFMFMGETVFGITEPIPTGIS